MEDLALAEKQIIEEWLSGHEEAVSESLHNKVHVSELIRSSKA
jgi:hypothetical protein